MIKTHSSPTRLQIYRNSKDILYQKDFIIKLMEKTYGYSLPTSPRLLGVGLLIDQ